MADLTGLRDRQCLDATLAQALRDLVGASQVTIAHRVGTPDDAHWAIRASLNGQATVPSEDPAWLPVEDLPPESSQPLWSECLASQGMLVRADAASGWVTVLPLRAEAGAVGVVELVTPRPLLAAEQHAAGLLIRVHRNVQSLLDYGEHDTLTGLLNRKTFDEALLKAATTAVPPLESGGQRQAGSAPASWWLAVVDIDFFKQVNDRFGHLIGDEVLLLVGQIMRSCFRQGDRAFRFGGEEFVVLLRCASQSQAAAAVERLRETIAAHTFPQVGQITISAGLTQVHAGDVPSAVLERADRALYFAKQNGRNQVQVHADLVKLGLMQESTQSGAVELF